jgi:hypothetical protein
MRVVFKVRETVVHVTELYYTSLYYILELSDLDAMKPNYPITHRNLFLQHTTFTGPAVLKKTTQSVRMWERAVLVAPKQDLRHKKKKHSRRWNEIMAIFGKKRK